MSSDLLSTRPQWFTRVRLPGPHLTPSRAPFPHRSPQRSLANAAWGGLKPPRAGRLRRATKPSSSEQHRFRSSAYIELPFTFRTHQDGKAVLTEARNPGPDYVCPPRRDPNLGGPVKETRGTVGEYHRHCGKSQRAQAAGQVRRALVRKLAVRLRCGPIAKLRGTALRSATAGNCSEGGLRLASPADRVDCTVRSSGRITQDDHHQHNRYRNRALSHQSRNLQHLPNCEPLGSRPPITQTAALVGWACATRAHRRLLEEFPRSPRRGEACRAGQGLVNYRTTQANAHPPPNRSVVDKALTGVAPSGTTGRPRELLQHPTQPRHRQNRTSPADPHPLGSPTRRRHP